MIAVTHAGKMGDFGFCLPVCSWLYKTTGEKIIFVLTEFPFARSIERLLRLQQFTHDVIYCNHKIENFDCGGQPYKFNPHDYVKDLNVSTYYNFGYRAIPDKFIPDFYAEEYNLGVDDDFVLNLNLDFKYSNNKIMCTEVLSRFFPSYETIDFSKDFLDNLRDLAYARERHVHASSLSVFLNLAGIPFYYYTIIRVQPHVNLLTFDKTEIIEPKSHMNLAGKKMLALDIRSLDENGKIISVYDQVYF